MSMRAALTLFILVVLSVDAFAGEIRKGATMQVKANSIWFEAAVQLEQWQQKKKVGGAKEFEAYQESLLHEREAWQFINPVKVKIIGYNPKKNRVYVEMMSKGRLEGAVWFLDVDALVR
jgi:hypothetical protein